MPVLKGARCRAGAPADGDEGEEEEMPSITQEQYDGMEQRAKTAELLVTTLQGQMSQQGEQLAALDDQGRARRERHGRGHREDDRAHRRGGDLQGRHPEAGAR